MIAPPDAVSASPAFMRGSRISSNPEVIDVDALGMPEQQMMTTGQGTRSDRAINIPSSRDVKYPFHTGSVQPLQKRSQKPREPAVIDLTLLDDDAGLSSPPLDSMKNRGQVPQPSISRQPQYPVSAQPRLGTFHPYSHFPHRHSSYPRITFARPPHSGNISSRAPEISSNTASQFMTPSSSFINSAIHHAPSGYMPFEFPPSRGVKLDSPVPDRARSIRQTSSSRTVTAATTSSRVIEDEEPDWDTLYDALNINDESKWSNQVVGASPHCSHSDFRSELAAAQEEANDSVYDSLKTRATHEGRSVQKSHAKRIQLTPRLRDQRRVWSTLDKILTLDASRPGSSRKKGTHIDRYASDTPSRHVWQFSGLKEVRHPGLLPGAVNSISQSGALIAITSCVSDGLAVTETEGIPYNREGTLVVIHKDRAMRLRGHERRRNAENTLSTWLDSMKYFSVSEAIFEPNHPDRLLSCGEDSRLIVWDCSDLTDEGKEPRVVEMYNYPQKWIPRGMAFQPNTSVLAVSSNKGQVYIHRTSDLQNVTILGVTPPPYTRGIQDIAWGCGATAGKLFVTSALDDHDDHDPCRFFGGFHRVFDVATGRMVLQLQNEDAGESMAVGPTGDVLALATSTTPGDLTWRFALGLYDVRAGRGDAVHAVPLAAFPALADDGRSALAKPRVNWLAFSPDGVYAAVARSDNRTQLFDTRALARGALCDFVHAPPTEGTESDGMYGVYKVEWVRDPRRGLGLVTSGADGCVRLWDVRRAQSESTVLARSDNYASWFSVGDPLRGERAVVLGDGGGTVVTKG